jgi:antitoxin HicB
VVVDSRVGLGVAMDYPVKLERDDNDTILVSFPDFPEAHTYGGNMEDALMHAPDALATVIDAYIRDRRGIPSPSACVTTHRVTVPALVEAKIRLYETMREAKIGKSELAKRLDWHPPQVDRLLAMTHGSKLEQLETAFRAMGKRLVIEVEDMTVLRDRPKSAPRRRRQNSASLPRHATPDRRRRPRR